MRAKNINDIRTEIIDSLNTYLPGLDVTEGTPERDLFIEAPIAGQLSSIWEALVYSQKLHAPLVYYDDLEEDEIDKFCATYNVIQRAATNSSGSVTFNVPILCTLGSHDVDADKLGKSDLKTIIVERIL